MAVRPTLSKWLERHPGWRDGWRDLVRPEPVRPKPQPQRKLWNEIEVKRSSGTDGKKLTAEALYPKGPDQTYAQAQAEAVRRGASSPLGTGIAKRSESKDRAWRERAERIRKAEQ
jgi:hypothetical protein